ncbi:MAG: glycosyltransferase family 1 protein [Clostridia bacterium]|nr:glycosyltransferase family 1 protein [Clostridia bacterium]
MKKVLFVATVLRGHLLVFHLPFMRWFQQRGYEVHVCARNDTGKPADIPYCDHYHEIAFERSPLNPRNVRAYRELKRVIDEENFAIIHCHTPVGGMLTRLAARSARRRGAKVLYTAHGFHFFTGAPMKNWLLFYPAERLLARYTDVLVTINQEDYARASRFPAKRVEYVPGVGIDLSRFHGQEQPDRALFDALGVAPDEPAVMAVGEFIPRKNHQTLLRAFAKLHHPKAKLLLCGVGEKTDELQALARELGIENRVLFLGFRRDVEKLLPLAQVFAFPSLQEGLPVSVMEAMACGLPCVVSRVRGNADLIVQGKSGMLRAPLDADGFAQDLDALLDCPALRTEMGAYNRRAVSAYGLDEILRRMGDIYQSLER